MPTTVTTTEHLLSPELVTRAVRVTVVGCGGTGAVIATGLVFLHQAMLAFGHPGGLAVTLVDGDRVSRANCVRQPFSESEIGLYKSTVLVNRINIFWGLDWQGQPKFLDEHYTDHTDVLIGCVDSRASRRKITACRAYKQCHYYLDVGNNADSGQFVLGQPVNARNKGQVLRLPTVAELFPEIVNPALDKQDKLPSCSAIEALERQEPFINQSLAYQALALLARLFRYGRLTHHGGFLNIATGRMSALPVDPRVWQQIEANGPRSSRRTVRR